MKQSEAKKIVLGMLIGAQRARSINDETGRREDDALNEIIEPWLYGKQDCRPLLIRLNERLDNGEELSPLLFMNLLHIALVTPSIAVCALRYGYKIPIPGVDVQIEDIYSGWEQE